MAIIEIKLIKEVKIEVLKQQDEAGKTSANSEYKIDSLVRGDSTILI